MTIVISPTPTLKATKQNNTFLFLVCFIVLLLFPYLSQASIISPITDTGQNVCYDNFQQTNCPSEDELFFGQDAQYHGNQPHYQDNGDGTVTDLVTGLMWSKGVDATKLNLREATTKAKKMNLAGYNDWRLPNIKELYSLIDFRGSTGIPKRRDMKDVPNSAIPYINTDFFDFRYGNTTTGERYIDAQWLSATRYVSTTMNGNCTLFGVNFADGRIKGYPNGVNNGPHGEKKFYVRYVRGNTYGINHFNNNNNGTISDKATGLMWMEKDSGHPMSWQQALAYAENTTFAGYSDWRLPNAKELQSLVDYSRSPDTTDSAAIDPLFYSTSITNEDGQRDFPYYWTSTTHQDGPMSDGVYISFGRAIGFMNGIIMDVHGAGAQRSDPKVGKAQLGHGPQGDATRINNFVRLVRGGDVDKKDVVRQSPDSAYPNTIHILNNNNISMQRTPNQEIPTTNHRRDRMPSQPQHFSGQAHTNRGSHFIARFDRNGDNRVSSSEFDGPPQHFSHIDKNGDGYITAQEAAQAPVPRK